MSKVVIANGVVYLAGQVPDTAHVSVTQSANEIITGIDTLLASAGIDKTRLLTANIWLTDANYFDEFNRIWDAWPPDSHTPSRAVAADEGAGLDVEIAVSAIAR